MTILSARAVADMLGMTRHHLNSIERQVKGEKQ